MLARILDNRIIRLEQVTPEAEALVDRQFSAKHPRFRFIDTAQQDWDGVYRKYNRRSQTLSRAFLAELEQLCHKHNLPLQVADTRSQPPPINLDLVDKNWLPGIELENYQINAIKTIAKHETGIFHHPTGSGKTEVVIGIIKLLNVPTVVIANQRVVIEQIKERLQLRDIMDVGLFYGGEMPNGNLVVVGSIQSMTTPPQSMLRKIKSIKDDEKREKRLSQYKARLEHARAFQQITKNSDLLLVDECDLATSKPYRMLFLHYFVGRRKYGFSATPFDKRKPVDNLILREHLGSIVSQSDLKVVEKLGRIIPIRYIAICFGQDKRNDKSAFDLAEREIIIDNAEFHQTVAQIVMSFPGEKTMILVDTTNVGDLGHALQKIIKGSVFIWGKTSKTARKKWVKSFEQGTLKCLIGGKILKRGLDIKGGFDNLILCGGGKLKSNVIQKAGRALRPNQKGWSRVFSFIFLGSRYLYDHSRTQMRAVIDSGYDTIVSMRGKTMSGPEFLKARFKHIDS